MFIIKSFFLGLGLAMDAFSVSIADGLNEPSMSKRKGCGIATIFGIFQGLMPILGWLCVRTILQYFKFFEKFIPWIALFLLGYIGISMIKDAVINRESEEVKGKLGIKMLMLQGVATSIDALSVGLAIADYNFLRALISVFIIAIVTFVICLSGLYFGKRIGMKYEKYASILGGAILLLIGIEIFVGGIF